MSLKYVNYFMNPRVFFLFACRCRYSNYFRPVNTLIPTLPSFKESACTMGRKGGEVYSVEGLVHLVWNVFCLARYFYNDRSF